MANGYICFYGSKKIEIYAQTSYEAYVKAIATFKVSKKNEHKVSVHLAEKNNEQVVHTADF